MGRKREPRKLTIELDHYEQMLLTKLQKELEAQGEKVSLNSLVQGCVRTAIHHVYGPDYAYDQLLSTETFEQWAKDSK